MTDLAKKFVADLTKGDFAVYEDGVQQDLTFFATGGAPLDLAILIDSSASMTEKVGFVQQAAANFVRTLHPGDRASIVAFSDGVRILQPPTGDQALLQAAVQKASAQGATALNNALYVTLKEFAIQARRDSDIRRQAIVVLSDGEDTASLISFDSVLELAKQSGVSIYTISLSSKPAVSDGGRRYFSQAEFGMKTLAQETGARAFFPTKLGELAGVYDSIADELAHQYSIGYVSKNARRDGRFRRLVVRVLSRSDVQPRTRLGYIVAATTGSATAMGSR